MCNIIMKIGLKGMGLIFSDVHTGAKNQLWAATGSKADINNGEYYTPVGVTTATVHKTTKNGKAAESLWSWQEEEFKTLGY